MPASIFGQYLEMGLRLEEILKNFGSKMPLRDQGMLLHVRQAILLELRDAGSGDDPEIKDEGDVR